MPNDGRNSLSAIVATLLLASATSQAMATEPLRIGYHAAWNGQGEIYETLAHTNILELNGVPATFHVFAYGGPLAEAAVAGDLDIGMAADVPILRVVGRRPEWKVVNRTHDWTWSVLVRPDSGIKTLADLRGKRLAAPFGTSVFPRTYRQLLKAGFKEPFKEITLINGDLGEQVEALQSKSVDAVASWTPTSQKIIEAGLAVPIYESTKDDGLAWQALGPAVLKDRGLAVRYLKAFVTAVWWASNHLDQAQKWYSETSHISPEMLRLLAKDDRYLRAPVRDIKKIDLAITPKETKEVQGVMDFLVEQKLLTEKMDVSHAVDDSLIRQAQADIRDGKLPPLASIAVVKP